MKDKVVQFAKAGKALWNKYGETAMKLVGGVSETTDKKFSPQGQSSEVAVCALKEQKETESLASEAAEHIEVSTEKILDSVEFQEVVPSGMEAEDLSKYERGSFEDGIQRLSDAVENAKEHGFSNPEAVVEALGVLAAVASDTVKYVADQETKQIEINAQRDVAIAKINATSEMIKTYLERTFDERSAIFAKQFECVDEALRNGNAEMLCMTLDSINRLATSSPFKNLADIGKVQKALNSSETEWDI